MLSFFVLLILILIFAIIRALQDQIVSYRQECLHYNSTRQHFVVHASSLLCVYL